MKLFFVSEAIPERDYMFDKDLHTGLSVIWNTGKPARFMIDNEVLTIGTNCGSEKQPIYKIMPWRIW